ncbi:hypothetical protein Q5P01_015360 [Channa striata]|uniref:Uncharacterized protein n=1 Tax=Channa striata TaxID=64152 RepID=A0AA88SM07_CHASR|nr:hypothetical protein Q5P01_015360 [Channa striata]
MASSSSCRPLPVALGPPDVPSTFTTCGPSSPSSLHPSPRLRRPRRVLYPACQSRRPPLREAPDQALRWLLLLSALVFLQIYSEDTNICSDLQSQCPDPAACQSQAEDGSLSTARGWTGEEPWRVQTVGGASENQLECVVS